MSTTEKPPVAARKPMPQTTSYIVLFQAAEGGPWIVGHVAKALNPMIGAASGEAAIKAYLSVIARDSDANPPYALVAVPARSWQPVKPKTTTVTKTTLEAL